jgi:hypothetical protein
MTKQKFTVVPADLISQTEAARIRGVSPQAITDLIDRGRLTVYEVAGKRLLSRGEVENYATGQPGPKPRRGELGKARGRLPKAA